MLALLTLALACGHEPATDEVPQPEATPVPVAQEAPLPQAAAPTLVLRSVQGQVAEGTVELQATPEVCIEGLEALSVQLTVAGLGSAPSVLILHGQGPDCESRPTELSRVPVLPPVVVEGRAPEAKGTAREVRVDLQGLGGPWCRLLLGAEHPSGARALPVALSAPCPP